MDWRVRRFYLVVAAMGVFCAECCCFNAPFALLVPPFYAVYGLVWVFLLDALIRAREERFWAWYLGGLLLGLITETFVAKVTFYGLEPDAHRVLGIAPGPFLFVIMGYHPFASFILPAYLLRRIFGLPIPLRVTGWRDALAAASPLVYSLLSRCVIVPRQWNPVGAWVSFALSAVVLGAWVGFWRRGGRIDDLRLPADARRRLFWRIAVPVYVLCTLLGTNEAHGGTRLPPFGPFVVVSLGIWALAVAWSRALGRGSVAARPLIGAPVAAAGPVPFDAGVVRWRPMVLTLAWMVAGIGAGIAGWHAAGQRTTETLIRAVAVGMVINGVVWTLASLASLGWVLLTTAPLPGAGGERSSAGGGNGMMPACD